MTATPMVPEVGSLKGQSQCRGGGESWKNRVPRSISFSPA